MLHAKKALEHLATDQQQVYRAAYPGYPSNFTRDSLTYGLLADDLDALQAQIAFSAEHQGTKSDPVTGEEPGKIHHEFPGVKLRGLDTTYNACDTTALFLLAIAKLARSERPEVLRRYRDNIDRALGYIAAHTVDGVFTEDPKPSGAEKFALKVTYWKDSELNTIEREPHYPIAYSLVHFQNKAAVQEMGHLLRHGGLLDRAWNMTFRGIQTFWNKDHFVIAKETNGRVVDTLSSDSLHTLLYIEPHEIEDLYPLRIVEYSEQLVTDIGYLPAISNVEGLDPYHIDHVWVHEQALLHAAARRHSLRRAEAVASRIIPAIQNSFPELVDPGTKKHAGNPTQLWAIGAYLYFKRLEAEILLGSQFIRQKDVVGEGIE